VVTKKNDNGTIQRKAENVKMLKINVNIFRNGHKTRELCPTL
jgi:hypothetical protein